MMIKQFLIMLMVLTVALSAEPISDVSRDVQGKKKSSGGSSSSSSRTYYKEQGGFNTEVHVLGSEKKFDRVRFVPKMFSAWISLYVETQAYDLITQLGELGYVNQDGTLKESVKKLTVPLTPNQVIQKDVIVKHYRNKYSETWIYDELVRTGVLDKQGFLSSTESFSDTYNAFDFEQYYVSLKQIKLNFSNPAIDEELLRELLRFLQESSLSIHVTQEETTRYQSRKEGFFESFLDQIGGAILGGIFFRDKVSTVKRKLSYNPNINVKTMFTNLKYGFAKSTYFAGAKGDVIFYGLDQRKSLDVGYARRDGLDHFSTKLSLMNASSDFSGFSNKMASVGGFLSFDQLSFPSGDHLQWYSLRGEFSSFDQGNDFKGSFGLSLLNDSYESSTKLGLGIGFNGAFHFFSPVGMYYEFDTNFGFNFLSDEPNWGFSNYGLGLQTGISPFRARLGYEWMTSHNSGRSLFRGLTASVTTFF